MRKDKRKSSKKIVSAAAMLMLSAAMLGTATFAWFTMSREVEVKNIRLTATVPEDLQISLGEISGGSSSANLADSTGFLVSSNNVVGAPTDSDDDDPFDWSNTADISAYYDFGKMIPAGSTNGENVFFTPDAAGVGKTFKDGAASYAAVAKIAADTTNVDSPATTAHVKTSQGETTWASGGTGNYTTASAWNVTNDDGYYIDIPVWLRTSSTTAPSVYVTGFIKKGTNTTSAGDTDTDNLYKAVRVAVLAADGSADGGVIDLYDQTGVASATYPASQASVTTMIDSGIADANFTITKGTGVIASALSDEGTVSATLYDDVLVNKGATSIGTLTAKAADSTSQYAAGTKFIIRVWLEGDDINCWNANAGQDWDISLKFMTSELPATTP